MPNKNSGLTLIEVTLYIALLSLMMTSIFSTLYYLSDIHSHVRNEVTTELEGLTHIQTLQHDVSAHIPAPDYSVNSQHITFSIHGTPFEYSYFEYEKN